MDIGPTMGGGVTQIFYWSPPFRICMGCLPKFERNLLKIGYKNTYFQVFKGFLSFFGFLVIFYPPRAPEGCGGAGGQRNFLPIPSFQNMYRLLAEIRMELA